MSNEHIIPFLREKSTNISPAARASLRLEIEHWRRVASGSGVGPSGFGPLCVEFYTLDYNTSCYGCPIAHHTGWVYCYKTPYDGIVEASESNGGVIDRDAADLMVAFLEGIVAGEAAS
jgi:hypothetical protein